MAIQKTKTLPNGTSGDYWKITNVGIDRVEHKLIVTISLFLDASASSTGKQPLLSTKIYRLSFTSGELLSDLINVIYTKVKDQANTMVSTNILGQPITPQPFDDDIAGGTDV